jgi:hypothetical protein
MPLEHEIAEAAKAEAEKKLYDAYEQLFVGADAEMVLRDLCLAGHVYDTVFHEIPRETDMRIGEHRIVMRILRFSGKLKAMKESIGVE